jgi:hypothetical protein
MSNIIKRIGILLTVKSIVTIMLAVVFSILALNGVISSEQYMTIFSVVIGFYFGTQYDKKNLDEIENKLGN